MKWWSRLPWRVGLLAVVLGTIPTAWVPAVLGQQAADGPALRSEAGPERAAPRDSLPDPPRSDDNTSGLRPTPPDAPPDPPPVLLGKIAPISLPFAFHLAGVQNPELMRARALTGVAQAARFGAVAMLLPNINVGSNFDAHTGSLQQSNGNIIKVNREALDFGLGTGAVAAGTASIPGINYNLNVALAYMGALRSRYAVAERRYDTVAVRNQALLRVALAYTDLLRAEGRYAIALEVREEVKKVFEIIRKQAAAGQTKISDAERAENELMRRQEEVVEAENLVLRASARLSQELSLDPSLRLHAVDGWVVPAPLVPPPVPLKQLVLIALGSRPELAARQAAIRQALVNLQAQALLPFSPTVLFGFSASDFGGGSNLAGYPPGVAPTPAFGSVQSGTGSNAAAPGGSLSTLKTTQERFGNFAQRTDVDTIFYWTAQNLGVGNLALVREARAVLRQTDARQLMVLNQVRRQVAQSYADSLARFAQINTSEQALRASRQGFPLNQERTFNQVGLAIEVLDSLRLLADSRYDLLDAITAFNQAQFALYVALGSPPADVLARAIPAGLVPPPPDARVEVGPGAAPCPWPVASAQDGAILPAQESEQLSRPSRLATSNGRLPEP